MKYEIKKEFLLNVKHQLAFHSKADVRSGIQLVLGCGKTKAYEIIKEASTRTDLVTDEPLSYRIAPARKLTPAELSTYLNTGILPLDARRRNAYEDLETLEEYLREGQAKGIIDYKLRTSTDEFGNIHFYIYPDSKNGSTMGFEVFGNLLITKYKT